MANKVVVLSMIPRLLEHLRLTLPNVTFVNVVPDKNNTLSSLSEAEVLVADAHLLAPYVDKLPKAKWVQATWAGLDKLLPKLKNKDISYVITRFTGGGLSSAMSEYVVSQIVNFERDQKRHYENQANCLWKNDGKISDYRRLCDLTVGILGMGEIGKLVARSLKMFGAVTWGMSRTIPAEKHEYLDKHITTEFLPEILKNCDYIINVLPSTNNTVGLLNGDVLKNCIDKKSVFVNIGRGSIIKETDLINAIEKNWISGAILDVFEAEPLPENSRLWKLPQVTITPHCSGVSKSEDIAKVFAENYVKYQKGDRLNYIIDIDRGY